MTIVAQQGNDPTACLYVIELGRRRIKVGCTVSPRNRLANHRSLAEAHGCKPGREWASPPGSGTGEREAKLIAFCAERADAVYRSEYFTGITFAAAVEKAAELCHDNETVNKLVARRHAQRRAVRLAEFRAMLPRSEDGVVVRSVGTFEEAAGWLQLPELHLQDLITSGRLPVIKMGKVEAHPRRRHGAVRLARRFKINGPFPFPDLRWANTDPAVLPGQRSPR